MATSRTDDVRKVVNTAAEQARTSLLAALGAGNLASQAVADAFAKARSRVSESSEAARKNIEDLPSEVENLRGRLDPAELRKLLDDYTESALRLYRKLAESGEQTWERLAEQPQFKRSIEQLEEALHAAQERVGGVTSDARERVDEIMALVTRRTREAGQKAGAAAEGMSEWAADTIIEAAPEPPEPRSAERPEAAKSHADKTTADKAKDEKPGPARSQAAKRQTTTSQGADPASSASGAAKSKPETARTEPAEPADRVSSTRRSTGRGSTARKSPNGTPKSAE